MGFFDEPQGAAVYKHALLSSYLPTFTSKTGSRSAGGAVGYLDAFAGAGAYEDGSPGSPKLALETAQALSSMRNLQCFFIESDRKNFTSLSALIADSSVADRAQAFFGEASDYLPSVLDKTRGLPLLAFLDPFGLGIPFDELTARLMARTGWTAGRRSGPVTEVLVNFVYAGVYRNASKLSVSTTDPVQVANAQGVVRRVNDNLGGDWWQPIWRRGGDTNLRVHEIRDEYARRVLAAAGPSWKHYRVAVYDTWQGSPVYDLILFTQSPQGLWFMNEAASLAWEKFRAYADPHKDQLGMWTPADTWIAEIERNVYGLVKAGPVTLIERSTEVYGRALGFARGTHVRKAIQRLDKQGMLAARPMGDLHKMTLRPVRGQLPDLRQTLTFFDI